MRVIHVQPVERTPLQLRLRRYEADQAADEAFRSLLVEELRSDELRSDEPNLTVSAQLQRRYHFERAFADVDRRLIRRAVLIARLRSYGVPEARSA
jgi:hypothetical protein